MSTFAIHSNVSKDAEKKRIDCIDTIEVERMETCTRLRKLIAHRSFCDIYLCTLYTVQPMFLVREVIVCFTYFVVGAVFSSSSSSFWFHFICVVHLIFTPLQELTVTKMCLTHQYLAYRINNEKRDSLIL